MVIQTTPTKIDKIASLRIGQRGENLATDIKMDVSDWIAVHPDANYYCLFKRPDEVQVQPVLSSLEEDVLTWTVRAWECAIIGVGYLEVRAVNPDTGLVAKSRVIPCAIEDSVIDDEGPVPPEMSWVGEVLAAKDTAVAAKTAAEEARDTARTTVNGAIAGIQAEGTTQVGAVQSEGTTQVGAVQAKGTEVLNSIPSDYSTLSGDVSGLKSALQVRGIPDKGTTGQVLRKKSGTDYDVEWASVGQPTDEQVQDAVDDYLDAHPEQTTTVVDWSLTPNKFVKGGLGYVTPQMFGAVADGETDDAQAIKDAIDYAMANGCRVYFPSGTYGVSPRVLEIEFTGNDSLYMYGDGKSSCIKRLDNSLTAKFDRIFVLNNANATSDSKELIVRDLFFDSNCRGQPNFERYTYEASADFAIYFSNSTYRLDTAIFQNLHFYDGVGDHLGFTGSAHVGIRHIIIDQIFASGRCAESERNDIDFPAWPVGETYISNVVVQDIHTEFNGTPTQDVYINIDNAKCRHLTVGGGKLCMNISRLDMHGSLKLNLKLGHITDSSFYINAGSYIHYDGAQGKVDFQNCNFIMASNNNTCHFINIEHYLDVIFSQCRFDYDGEQVSGYPLRGAYLRNPTYKRKLTLDCCTISEKFSTGLYLYSCGEVIISNMQFYNKTPVFITGGEGDINVYFGPNVHVMEYDGDGYVLEYGTCTAYSMIVDGEIDVHRSKPRTGPGSSFTSTDVIKRDVKQRIWINEPATNSLIDSLFKSSGNNYWSVPKNVELIYAGNEPNRYPQEWVWWRGGAYNVSTRNYTNDMVCKGDGVGNTKERPACLLTPGFIYFDTTLNQNVVWDGTRWINSDGTAATTLNTATGTTLKAIQTDMTKPFALLNVSIMPEQSGSGTPSSENVRQLTGRTGVTIERFGKNLFDNSFFALATSYPTSASYGYKRSAKIQLAPNTAYTIKPNASGQLTIIDNYGVLAGSTTKWIVNNKSYGNAQTFTTDSTGQVLFMVHLATNVTATLAEGLTEMFTAMQLQLEEGSSATTYEAYQTKETLADIDWTSVAGSVYGGSIDAVSGKLISRPYYASYNRETLVGPWISSMDVYDPENPDTPPTTGAQVVDLGGTPTEYNLTPEEISTVSGVNNISNDINGEMTIEYWAH